MIIQKRWDSTGTSTRTIDAPGLGRYNILKSINVKGDGSGNITISSPTTTTIWQTELLGPGGFDKTWGEEDGVRGAENQDLVIACTSSAYKISVSGVVA